MTRTAHAIRVEAGQPHLGQRSPERAVDGLPLLRRPASATRRRRRTRHPQARRVTTRTPRRGGRGPRTPRPRSRAANRRRRAGRCWPKRRRRAWRALSGRGAERHLVDDDRPMTGVRAAPVARRRVGVPEQVGVRPLDRCRRRAPRLERVDEDVRLAAPRLGGDLGLEPVLLRLPPAASLARVGREVAPPEHVGERLPLVVGLIAIAHQRSWPTARPPRGARRG